MAELDQHWIAKALMVGVVSSIPTVAISVFFAETSLAVQKGQTCVENENLEWNTTMIRDLGLLKFLSVIFLFSRNIGKRK